MAYEMSLSGRFFYDSPATARLAIEDARRLILEEDPDFADAMNGMFERSFVPQDNVVDIHIDLYGPADFWFGLESVADVLSQRASDGHLDGRSEMFEGRTVRFHAGSRVEDI